MTVTTYSTSVAGEVRAEMARQRLTQRGLAVRLGWSVSALQRRLNDQIAFSTSELEELARAFRIPLSALISPRANSK